MAQCGKRHRMDKEFIAMQNCENESHDETSEATMLKRSLHS